MPVELPWWQRLCVYSPNSTMVEQSQSSVIDKCSFPTHYHFLVMRVIALHLIKNTERVKYCHPEYSDGEIDGLMRYFRLDTYIDFLEFMRRHKKD